MELALAGFNVGVGLGLLAVGGAVAYLAWRLTPLVRDARALVEEMRALTRATQAQVPSLVDRAEELVSGADALVADAAVAVSRLGAAADAVEGGAAHGPQPTASQPASASVESRQTPDGWSD